MLFCHIPLMPYNLGGDLGFHDFYDAADKGMEQGKYLGHLLGVSECQYMENADAYGHFGSKRLQVCFQL